MRTGESLLWLCSAAAPVAMVYGDRLRRVPNLVSGLLGSKRAAKTAKQIVAMPKPQRRRPASCRASKPTTWSKLRRPSAW